MRYHSRRNKSSLLNSILIFTLAGVFLAGLNFRQTKSLVASLIFLPFYVAMSVAAFRLPNSWFYWEICDDCVIQRRYFGRTVFPFSDITYVGPFSGQLSRLNMILIRNTAGKRMIVNTDDPQAFLAEMREHLPRITLNL
jgi:hypothetical protein